MADAAMQSLITQQMLMAARRSSGEGDGGSGGSGDGNGLLARMLPGLNSLYPNITENVFAALKKGCYFFHFLSGAKGVFGMLSFEGVHAIQGGGLTAKTTSGQTTFFGRSKSGGVMMH